MTALLLAAALSCLTPHGDRATLVRTMYTDEREAYSLPVAAQWCAFAVEGDTLRWPTGQRLQVTMKDGRVVRSRRLLVNWAYSIDTQELGIREVRVKASDLSGSTNKITGKRGVFVAAAFAESFPLDSVQAISVGAAIQP